MACSKIKKFLKLNFVEFEVCPAVAVFKNSIDGEINVSVKGIVVKMTSNII